LRRERLIPLTTIAALLFLSGAAARAVQDVNQSYLPLSKAETARRFPVRYVGVLLNRPPGYRPPDGEERLIPERLDIGPSGASVRHDSDERMSIVGRDARGREWRVLLGATAYSYPCRFYTADLDRNRTRDAVFVCPTGGNGLAPSRHLFALTFDSEGRPVPFEAEGYFEDGPRGVFDLVDTDRDGRAELIHMSYDDGYWITNLYEAQDARWRRVAGRHGRRSYPLYTRFTHRPNRRPTAPRAGRSPAAPDLSNDAPKLTGRLLSYRWANIAQSEDIGLTVSDARAGRVECAPVSWHGSFGFVIDADEGRTIMRAYGNEEETKSLLDETAGKQAEIVLYGQRVRDKCSPEWGWVVRRQ
jgi:hypothetical protein